MAQRLSFAVALALAVALLHPCLNNALQLCLTSDPPYPLNTSLAFCSSFLQNQSSCCDTIMDQQLETKFKSFNVANIQCAGFLKQILCAQCDPYAADLFGLQLQEEAAFPILCNSTSASNESANSYCANLWSACKDVLVENSPFVPSLQGPGGGSQPPALAAQSAAKLADLWKSQNDFCSSSGGSGGSGEFCYSGEKYTFLSNSSPQVDVQGICFEKIGEGVYLNMVPHPDGSNRVFLSTQTGEIWLATLPAEGSSEPLSVNNVPYLDITSRVVNTGENGLLGVAFHPDFKNNGRFFVSYNCDKQLWPDCGGRCSCNVNTGCTISELGPEAGPLPCWLSSVIGEYSANSSSSSPFEAVTADPDEKRRVFTMGLPYTTHHAGQLLFGPTDKYLYFMMGDGGSSGDPFNFAQNKRSLLGKILRLDIDIIPSAQDISNLQLWGNYSIPTDNPFVEDSLLEPEIWVYGMRNPWRCSFDKINPSYFFCADVGQEKYEEVDLITRGGNYGWRVYEGPALYTPLMSPGGNTSVNSIQPMFPILSYSHTEVNPKEGTASITGGYVSRSTLDACLYGRYVYADLYGGAMWAAEEAPPGSGNFSTERVKFTCSANSPLECQKTADGRPNFVYAFSFGQDNSNNLYVLSATGVYKVVSPKACNYTCNATLPVTATSPTITASPSPSPAASPPHSPTNQSAGSARLPYVAFVLSVLCHLILSILL